MPLICRGMACAPLLLGLQRCDAFLYSLSLGSYVFQVDLAGLCLGPDFAQIGFQLSDAFGPADEPPLEASRVFRVVTVVFVAPMMLTVPSLAATAALGLATSTLAPASFLAARALAATFAACLLAVMTVPTPVLAVVSTATPVSAFASATTSALSAHRLQPPVLI